MRKIWLIIGGVVVLGALVVAGYFVWQKFSWQSPFPKTKAGLSFEEFLPEDTFLFLSYHPTDDSERARFKKLWDIILQDKKEALPIFLATGLTNRQKVRQIIRPKGEAPGTSTSVSPDILLKLFDEVNSFAVGLGPGSPPKMYILFSVENPNSENIQKYLAELNKMPNTTATLEGDVVVITNADSSEPETKSSLADNKTFRKLADSFEPPSTAYAFISPEFPGLVKVGASIANIQSKDNGILATSITLADNKDAKSSYSNLFKPYFPFLHTVVPGKSVERTPILYTESTGLGDAVLILSDAFVGNERFHKNFQALTGFDFQNDVKPALDNGFAFTLHDTGSLIPSFSLFINAGSGSSGEKALNIIKALQDKDTGWIILGNLALQAGKDAPVIEERKRFKKMFYAGTIKIHLDRIPREIADIPLFASLTEPLEISYGMTDSNILFFSTLPSFEQVLEEGATIEKSIDFPSISEALGIEPGSITYFDFAALGDYIERIYTFAKSQDKLSQSQAGSYEFLKKHLSPIKKFLQMSQVDSGKILGKTFLRIEP